MTEFHIKNPTLYDIAFTDTVQCDQKECQDMKERYPFTDSLIPFEDNFKHKFLIDIVRFSNMTSYRIAKAYFMHTGRKYFLGPLFGIIVLWISCVQADNLYRIL